MLPSQSAHAEQVLIIAALPLPCEEHSLLRGLNIAMSLHCLTFSVLIVTILSHSYQVHPDYNISSLLPLDVTSLFGTMS